MLLLREVNQDVFFLKYFAHLIKKTLSIKVFLIKCAKLFLFSFFLSFAQLVKIKCRFFFIKIKMLHLLVIF